MPRGQPPDPVAAPGLIDGLLGSLVAKPLPPEVQAAADKARAAALRGTVASLEAAVASSQDAIARAPDSAEPFAALALALMPRFFSSAIQSLVACLAACLAFTAPAC